MLSLKWIFYNKQFGRALPSPHSRGYYMEYTCIEDENLIYIQLGVLSVCVRGLQNSAGKHTFCGVDEAGQSGSQQRE